MEVLADRVTGGIAGEPGLRHQPPVEAAVHADVVGGGVFQVANMDVVDALAGIEQHQLHPAERDLQRGASIAVGPADSELFRLAGVERWQSLQPHRVDQTVVIEVGIGGLIFRAEVGLIGDVTAERDLVAARAADEGILAVADLPDRGVVARATVDCVRAQSAFERVVSGLADEIVGADAAGESVVAVAAVERVDAVPAEDRVVASVAPDGVRAAAGVEHVSARQPVDLVVSNSRSSRWLAARFGGDRLIVTVDLVVTNASVNGVVTSTTHEQVSVVSESIGRDAGRGSIAIEPVIAGVSHDKV